MHPILCFTNMQIRVLLGHNMAAIKQVRISDIANFTHSKNLDNTMEKLQQPLISCENYLSPWKCTTTPELSKVYNVNGKVKNSTKL